jgi:hypothetical protein
MPIEGPPARPYRTAFRAADGRVVIPVSTEPRTPFGGGRDGELRCGPARRGRHSALEDGTLNRSSRTIATPTFQYVRAPPRITPCIVSGPTLPAQVQAGPWLLLARCAFCDTQLVYVRR